MRIILITALLLFCSVISIAQKYLPVDVGSKVHFVINNFGIGTGGDLSGLKGTIQFDPQQHNRSMFNVSVDVKSIDTDSETRNKHLQSADYFDAEQYPLICLVSTEIKKNNSINNGYIFTGTLSMHGVNKNISFPFTVSITGNDLLFSGDFEINRLDYGVGSSSAVLSKTVKISLSVMAKKI
ncbi:YceI family protein [soil metagenome]